MTWAVLPSRNEPYCGEREVCMRRFPDSRTSGAYLNHRLNPNPNHNSFLNPNFNISRNDLRQRNESLSRSPMLSPAKINNDTPSLNQNKEGSFLPNHLFQQGYMTLALSSYSRRGLKELKKRLISNLEQVRSLLTRIDAQKLEFGPGFHKPQFKRSAIQSNHQQPLDVKAEDRTPKAKHKNQSSESVSLKGKGKKNRKLSGQKRALALADVRVAKRPVVVAEIAKDAEEVSGAVMKKCKQLLVKLMKDKYAWVFNKPVDVESLGLHDYYQVIKHPMDLGTIKSKLNKMVYRSPPEFAADVRLTFNNAMIYNPKGQDVHTMAESMLRSFEQIFAPVYQQYEADHQKPFGKKMNQNSNWVEQEQVILMPNKKLIMTDEEKLRLVMNLQNMPQEKMEEMVHIVRKRNPDLVQEGDEIELDLEALDNETLLELDRFVRNCHSKVVSQMNRQEVVEDAVFTQEAPKSPVSEPCQEMDVGNNKNGDAGEEDIDIGEDIPANDFPSLEIEKDEDIEKGIVTTSAVDVGEDPTGADSGSSSSSGSSGSSSSSDDSSSSDSDSDEDSVQSPYVEPRGVPEV